MKFWQRYKAKKEQEKKLNKARFINFYGVFEIDFSLGEIKGAISLNLIAEDTYYNEYWIVIEYENFVEKKFKICVYNPKRRDRYYKELLDFLNSEKYIEKLNYYNQLKYGQDVSKLELASNKPIGTNEGNIINLSDYK
jgi:hypothetical protein